MSDTATGKSKKTYYQQAAVHTACWAGYITYEQLVTFVVTGSFRLTAASAFFYVVNIGLFYLQGAVLQHTLGYKRSRYLMGVCLVLLALFASVVIKSAGEYYISKTPAEYLRNSAEFQRDLMLNLARSLFYQIAGTAFWSVRNTFRMRQAAAEAELRVARVENALLRQQINPHLLFNTLNFVFGTVHKHSRDGARAVSLLTEILDFSINSGNSADSVRVDNELEQVENLLRLNSFRFDFELPVALNVSGDIRASRIIPLVLLTLVENMFVHGDFRDKPAKIDLAVTAAGQLDFETCNFISRKAFSKRGTGLKNVRMRLEYAYPDNFLLETGEKDDQFFTKLRIRL